MQFLYKTHTHIHITMVSTKDANQSLSPCHNIVVNHVSPSNNRKETFGFVTLIVILLIVSIATTITNIVIIYKLRLMPGFQYFDLTNNKVVFHKNTYIDRIQLVTNEIKGLSTISGNVEMKSDQSSVKINDDGIHIAAPRFEIRSPVTNQLLFPFDFDSIPLNTIKTVSVPNGIRDVDLIRSPLNEDLNITAKRRIRIRGNEGVHIEGRRIDMQAYGIFLSSINSSIILDAHKGVYLNMNLFTNKPSDRDPTITTTATNSSQQQGASSTSTTVLIPQYKLCVCAKNGNIFRIPIKDSTSSCADVRFPQSENPCM